MYKHQQSRAAELQGQRSCRVHVKVCSFRMGEQKYLRSVLVRDRWGQDCGGVFINFCLAAKTHKIQLKGEKWNVRVVSMKWNYFCGWKWDHGSILTTSGASISCRKEWRLRVVRGFDIVVNRQRSDMSEFMDPVWSRQWRNHTWDPCEDSVLGHSQTRKIKLPLQQVHLIFPGCQCYHFCEKPYLRYFKTGPPVIRANWYVAP